MFVYHNNFWLNLHEFLRGEVYRRSAKPPPAINPSSLNGSERTAWESAIEVYTEVAKHDRVLDEESRRITNALSTTGNAKRLREGLLDARVTNALNRAAPIYRARLWTARQRDNDDWNAWAKALTDRHRTAMAAALAKAYGITWPSKPYFVDAVGETGGNPAFTHAPPSSQFRTRKQPLTHPVPFEVSQRLPYSSSGDIRWNSIEDADGRRGHRDLLRSKQLAKSGSSDGEKRQQDDARGDLDEEMARQAIVGNRIASSQNTPIKSSRRFLAPSH
jgi:hypothetical protein